MPRLVNGSPTSLGRPTPVRPLRTSTSGSPLVRPMRATLGHLTTTGSFVVTTSTAKPLSLLPRWSKTPMARALNSCGENAKKSLAINPNSSYPLTMKDIDTYITNAHSDDFATEAEERATLNTFAAEPAVEQEPEPEPYDGCEGQWPGDGSGLDDLADWGEQEGWDN